MDKTGDVVQRPAVLRCKRGGAGVDEVQGEDQFGHGIQQMVSRGGLVLTQPLVLQDPVRFRLQQFLDHPLIHAAGAGVHGHDHPGLQPGGRVAGVEQGRDMELAGQGRHVSGDAAEVGHDGRRLSHEPNKPRGRARGHQHRALRKRAHVSFLVHRYDRTGPHSRKGGVPSFQEHGYPSTGGATLSSERPPCEGAATGATTDGALRPWPTRCPGEFRNGPRW